MFFKNIFVFPKVLVVFPRNLILFLGEMLWETVVLP